MMKELYGKGPWEEKCTLSPQNRKSTVCLESRMSTEMSSNKWLKRQHGSKPWRFLTCNIKIWNSLSKRWKPWVELAESNIIPRDFNWQSKTHACHFLVDITIPIIPHILTYVWQSVSLIYYRGSIISFFFKSFHILFLKVNDALFPSSFLVFTLHIIWSFPMWCSS